MIGTEKLPRVAARGSITFRIGLATFGILALELAMIRWTSGQVRIFAYFNNLVLIGAFLGMGLGLALGRRRPELHHGTLPSLLLVSLVLAFSRELGLMHIAFPDVSITLWGGEVLSGSVAEAGTKLLAFFGLFLGVVAVFVFAGSAVGSLFQKAPALRAYSADLLGSLLGVLVFTLATALGAAPPVWLLLGGLPFAWLSRRPSSWLVLAAVVALGWYSIEGAVFSPYNRIDLSRAGSGTMLSVNRDFHQYMHDLSDERMRDATLPERERRTLAQVRRVYDLPFVVNDLRQSALIVGAGTGNDVQAALRNGYRSVVSVDIDGRIIDLGRRLHPEKPYDDPRVVPVVNDARAFFEQYRGPAFDVVCYGLLDSHAMFSALSTLRLDNYVYTEEGIRAAWRHVSPRGHLALSFSIFAGRWLSDRLYWTIARATGVLPVVIHHGMHNGSIYLVARDLSALRTERIQDFPRLPPLLGRARVRATSDDWPFLYIRPGIFPWGYVAVLLAVLLLASASVPWAFGRGSFGAGFDPVLFFMGAGFLLIETRGVTALSLLFGSTWVVNAAVFAGILIVALLANLYVDRFGAPKAEVCFVLLLLSVVLLWQADSAALNRYSLPVRGLLGGALNGLPIGFAGLIVSVLLARSKSPAAALGSNLLGSVVGGCLEYLSMVVGLRALVLIALALYLGALLLFLRRSVPRDAPRPAPEAAAAAGP